MALIIDAPVGPASPKAGIEKWIAKLDAMAQEHIGNAEDLETIADARQEAVEWLTPVHE